MSRWQMEFVVKSILWYGILYPYCPVVGMMCWLVMVMISDSLSHDAIRYWGVGDKYGIVWDSMSQTTEIKL